MAYPAKTFRPLRKEFRLSKTPAAVVARSSSYANNQGVEVLLETQAGGFAASQFMTAEEARQIGQALLDVAAYYESEVAKAAAEEGHGFDRRVA